ncbi:MAG: outer membrane beta-barrel protein [Lentisphaerae bacterium]|nr:outer membrane beta-barrel protein [Lentisphaerota bacterium]
MTKAWRLMAVLVIGGSLVSTLEVAAQIGVAPSDDATPMAARNPFDLGVGLRAEYTDNRDAAENNEESTAYFYVTPRIDAYVNSERTVLDFFYAPSLRYCTDPSETQNDTELLHALGLKIDHSLTAQTKVRLYESFLYQDDPSISESGSMIRANRTYFLNTVELGLRQELSRWSYADLSGNYMVKRYKDDDAADESDEDRLGAQGILWRQVTPTMGVRGTAGLSSYSYQSSLGLDRDFDVYLGAVGLDKVFSPQLRGGLDVGAQASEYSDDSLDSSVDPYAQVNAQIAPNPLFRIKGNFLHGVRESDAYPFASQQYSQVHVGLEADTSSLLTIGADGTYRLSDYSGDSRPAGSPAPLPGTDADGNETTIGLGAHATWKLGENARFSLRHLYEDVDSDVAESFSKNTSTVDLQLDI